jgi:hypothetical protein
MSLEDSHPLLALHFQSGSTQSGKTNALQTWSVGLHYESCQEKQGGRMKDEG